LGKTNIPNDESELRMKRILLKIGISLILVLNNAGNASLQVREQAEPSKRVFYVATNGDDHWTGTLPAPASSMNDGPFATLQRARNVVREMRQNDSKDAITVLVRGGFYELTETFVLGPEDSGTEFSPLVFRAFEKEHPILSGTRRINNFEPYKGKILKANLAGMINESQTFRQLFGDGNRKILARYPNYDPFDPIGGGFLYVETPAEEKSKRKFIYKNGDAKEWTNLEDAEVFIYPGSNWGGGAQFVQRIERNKRIVTLSQEATNEIKSGNRYFFQNLLEELDSPGEWFFDRQGKKLYYWPVDDSLLGSVTVPVLKSIVEIKVKKYDNNYYGTPSDIRFEGFTLVGCEESAIVVNGGKRTVIAGNTIYNAGGHGIEILNGFGNAAVGNDIYAVGSTGIKITGGDSKTLAPAKNRAENNYIHHIGIFVKHSSGIFCSGVGNILSHNLIHSTPRMGIWFDGNDHLIEYNHIHHVNRETQDSGAIYCSQIDWTKRGTIVQYNYIHDSGGFGRHSAAEAWRSPFDTYCIYIDDWSSGTTVYGNIVTNCASGGIFIHAGRDNIVENNVIVEGGDFGQMVYSGWPITHPTTQQLLPIMYEKIKELGYTKYPQLSTIKDIDSGAKMSGNSFVRNIVYYTNMNVPLYGIYNHNDPFTNIFDYNTIYHGGFALLVPFTKASGDLQWNKWKAMGFDRHSIISDPLFFDVVKRDFRLSPISPALKIGFMPIPIEKIGPYKDPLRASWPITEPSLTALRQQR
jgi:parallel beta-helix repeat protein